MITTSSFIRYDFNLPVNYKPIFKFKKWEGCAELDKKESKNIKKDIKKKKEKNRSSQKKVFFQPWPQSVEHTIVLLGPYFRGFVY